MPIGNLQSMLNKSPLYWASKKVQPSSKSKIFKDIIDNHVNNLPNDYIVVANGLFIGHWVSNLILDKDAMIDWRETVNIHYE